MDARQYYWSKRSKLENQLNEESRVEHVEARALFKGLRFHINSTTNPTKAQLKEEIVKFGGKVTNHVTKDVTHVLSETMCFSKLKKKSKRTVVLKPKWVLDSIREKKRMKENDYFVKKDGNQSLLNAFKNTCSGISGSELNFPNICGKSDEKEVSVLFEEWVLSSNDIFDEDLAYVSKYFFDLLDNKEHVLLKHVVSGWRACVEKKEHVLWKQCFNEIISLISPEVQDLLPFEDI